MYGFSWIKKSVNWTFGLLGYQPTFPVEINNLIFAYNDRLFEIDALVKSLGTLEKDRRETNDMLTTLMMLHGKEEFVLHEAAIQKVVEQNLETVLIHDAKAQTMTLQVQIGKTLMGNEDAN